MTEPLTPLERELVEALTELMIYHDVPAEAQDPVVLPLLKAGFAAIAKAEEKANGSR